MTREELHEMLAGLAQYSDRLPDLPTESFSRESFYEERVFTRYRDIEAVHPRDILR